MQVPCYASLTLLERCDCGAAWESYIFLVSASCALFPVATATTNAAVYVALTPQSFLRASYCKGYNVKRTFNTPQLHKFSKMLPAPRVSIRKKHAARYEKQTSVIDVN